MNFRKLVHSIKNGVPLTQEDKLYISTLENHQLLEIINAYDSVLVMLVDLIKKI